ncbi:MAG: hypothetical protein JW741_16400 [Sedimentisphaerales bacterium]|nr:hypothetical protein [Sedimentisphaerales bacterium]
MRNAQEPNGDNRETRFPSGSGGGTKAFAWNRMQWQHIRRMLAALAITLAGSTAAWTQIVVDGRYWSYDGRRVLLLGGWNHGHNPFIDHDTDNDKDNQGVSTPAQIEKALDELAGAGGNLLRCVLDPGMAAGIQGFDFCAKSGARYDLNTMTGPFWERIETFIAEAQERDIIVQIELWDRFDWIDGSWGSWPVSPWNPKNNVNYTTESSGLATSYQSFARHPFLHGVPGHPEYEKAPGPRKKKYDLVRNFQDKFVDKLLSITLRHGNVLYCMNNETHADPAWGQYWMQFIERKAKAESKSVSTTDMFDDVYRAQSSRGLTWQLAHRDAYDYVDASQANSRHADEAHWNAVRWIAEAARKTDPPYLLHMTKIYGNDLALDGKPWSRFKPGDSDNAIEEWWRNLLAGVAGVRFHRPTAGIGLCPESKNCIRATRKVESKVKFWDVEPRLDLLTDRRPDEAYLAADPGSAYILYFTKNGGGSVGLKLDDYRGKIFELHWVNVATGNWGPATTIRGGSTITITRPTASAHWVATIVAGK